MQGPAADDPNDRIRHEDRRSLRASWMLAAWLAVYDASAINTLDSYVEEDGRHFVRHYLIDFGAGLGSATSDVKGPHGRRAVPGRVRPHAGVDAVARASTGGPTSRSAGAWAARSSQHPGDRLVPGGELRRRGVPDQPQGPGAQADDRPGRLLGRQGGDVVHRRAARRRRRGRAPRRRATPPTSRGRSPSAATSSAGAI